MAYLSDVISWASEVLSEQSCEIFCSSDVAFPIFTDRMRHHNVASEIVFSDARAIIPMSRTGTRFWLEAIKLAMGL